MYSLINSMFINLEDELTDTSNLYIAADYDFQGIHLWDKQTNLVYSINHYIDISTNHRDLIQVEDSLFFKFIPDMLDILREVEEKEDNKEISDQVICDSVMCIGDDKIYILDNKDNILIEKEIK